MQVDHALFDVGLDDAHVDGRSVMEDALGVTSDKTPAPVVEEVEVVRQVANVQQALAQQIVDLDEDAEVGDARDDAAVDLAKVFACHHDHGQLGRCAFGIDAGTFRLRAMVGHAACIGIDGLPALRRDGGHGILFEHAVDEQIGIAADGRREVRVVLEAQTVVADVGLGIDGLCLTAEQQGIDDGLVGPV